MTVSVEEQHTTPESLPNAESNGKQAHLPPPRDEYASFEDLMDKPARERDIVLKVGDKSLKLHLRAIGHLAYDRLVADSPPSEEDKRKGLIYSDEVFGPKLISAVVARPKMDLDRATRLFNDPNWAGGEIGGLYRACVEICQVGLDVPFTGTG